MRVLALETSSVVAGVAILDDNKLLYEAYNHHKKNHSQIIMPLVEEALLSCSMTLEDIDIYAISKGPGSFTGLRIGIATVKGLAEAVKRPVAAIPTLETLAYNIPYFNGLVCPILDARREQVYTCVYKWQNDRYKKLLPYNATSIEKLIEVLRNYSESVIFIGDGVEVYRDILKPALGYQAIFAPSYLSHQRASTTAWLGLNYYIDGKCEDHKQLVPFYLRQSQAEQMKEKEEGK